MMPRNIMSASSTSSNVGVMRRTNYTGEFDVWKLVKRSYGEDPYCMTSKFRNNARVQRIKRTTVTRTRRLTECENDAADGDDSSSTSSGFTQDWETFDDEDDELFELYDILNSKECNMKTLGSIITATKPSPEVDSVLLEEVAHTGSRAQKIYMKKCAEFQISPSKVFLKALNSSVIDIGHQNIGPKGTEACAIALTQTSGVRVLNMNDNAIGYKGAKALAYLLRDNTTITELNLSDNRIGYRGAKYLTYVISEHDRIKRLDLSNNGFKDKDANLFKQMLEETRNLCYLNLSHNELREEGGVLMGEAISYNDGLEELDLSCNHLRRAGMEGIAEGLMDNGSLKTLNLAWNGFYLEGCIGLQKSLPYNTTLRTLDLTNNRINRECVEQLSRGLAKNTTLSTLILKFNPLTKEGAYDMLQFINECPTCGINLLDLGPSQQVSKAFMSLINEVHIKERQLRVLHGQVIGEGIIRVPDLEQSLIKEHAPLVLIEFGKMMGFRLMDLFASLDKDGSRTLDRSEIESGLKLANVPFSDDFIDTLIKKLDKDGDGEIDFSELLVAQQEYREELLVLLEAERGLSEMKVEDTPLYRIRGIMQKLFAEKMSDYMSFKRIAETLAKHVKKANDEIETKREAITKARAAKPREVRSKPTSPVTYKPKSSKDSLLLDEDNMTSSDQITRLDLVKIQKVLNDEYYGQDNSRRKMSIHLPIREKDRMRLPKNQFGRKRNQSETSRSSVVVDDSCIVEEVQDSDS